MAARDPKTGRFPKGNGAGRGGPAKGAGTGKGWGGPARGASTSRIRPGDPESIQRLSNNPDVKARQALRAEALTDHLFDLAMNAERQETQLAAAVACLDRIEGKPIQRSVTATVADPSSLSDAELVAIIKAGTVGPED